MICAVMLRAGYGYSMDRLVTIRIEATVQADVYINESTSQSKRGRPAPKSVNYRIFA
jgi:hypothetical protein